MNRIKVKSVDRFVSQIVNNVTGKVIKFPVMPEGISESVTANYSTQDIVGASAPRILYSSTSAPTVSVSLRNLTEDYLAEGFSSLREYVRALQALTYPTYSSGTVNAPSVTVKLGNFSFTGVTNSVNVTWGTVVKDGEIMSCSVDLQFTRTRDSVYGATYIEAGK